MSIAQIRETKVSKVAAMRQILTAAESEKRSLNQTEQVAFDKIKTEVQDLEGQESRAATLEDFERRALGSPVGDKHAASLENQVNVVDVIRAGMEGRSLTGAAAEYQAETERRTGRKAQGVFVPMRALESRSVNTTATAGQLVGTDHRAQDYIEPFRNSLLARKLGVRVLSGLTGNVSIPKYATGNTTGWVAENSALPTGGMTFDNVTLAPKHAGGITEMSRALIQQSSPDVEALIRGDLSALLAQAIDAAIITGGGTNEPVGILSTVGIQTGSLATLSWPAICALIEKLELANVDTSAASWLVTAKAKTQLTSKQTTTAANAMLMEGGKIANINAYSTNQLANKTSILGRVLLGDFSQVLLGIWSEVDLLVNPFDSVAYARGGVLVRAMSTVDIAVRHPEAFVLAEDLTIV